MTIKNTIPNVFSRHPWLPPTLLRHSPGLELRLLCGKLLTSVKPKTLDGLYFMGKIPSFEIEDFRGKPTKKKKTSKFIQIQLMIFGEKTHRFFVGWFSLWRTAKTFTRRGAERSGPQTITCRCSFRLTNGFWISSSSSTHQKWMFIDVYACWYESTTSVDKRTASWHHHISFAGESAKKKRSTNHKIGGPMDFHGNWSYQLYFHHEVVEPQLKSREGIPNSLLIFYQQKPVQKPGKNIWISEHLRIRRMEMQLFSGLNLSEALSSQDIHIIQAIWNFQKIPRLSWNWHQ